MLLFDFDGVLMDSLDEVVVNTYGLVTDHLCLSLDEIPSIYCEQFRKYRYMVQPAGDFIPFARWCLQCSRDKELRSIDLDSFRNLLAAEPEPLKLRSKRFFAVRHKRIEVDRVQWLNLHKPYEPLWSVIRSLSPAEVVILTNKNKEAVMLLGEHYGVRFDETNIYAAEGGNTKLDNFTLIEKRYGKRRYTFIDDSILNLLEMKQLLTSEQLEPLLATWGYVGPDDRKNAFDNEIAPVEQVDIIKKLRT